jgi:hypothetical protein
MKRRVGMKKGIWILAFAMLFALSAPCFSAPFKVYPGARLEGVYEPKQSEVGGKIAKAPKVITFTTDAPFETVVVFYRSNAREYRMPGGSGKPIRLPSGQELKEAYFILDGASDLSASKHWIKIQRPYIDKGRTGDPFYGKSEKIREVTAIIEEEKTSYP